MVVENYCIIIEPYEVGKYALPKRKQLYTIRSFTESYNPLLGTIMKLSNGVFFKTGFISVIACCTAYNKSVRFYATVYIVFNPFKCPWIAEIFWKCLEITKSIGNC